MFLTITDLFQLELYMKARMDLDFGLKCRKNLVQSEAYIGKFYFLRSELPYYRYRSDNTSLAAKPYRNGIECTKHLLSGIERVKRARVARP